MKVKLNKPLLIAGFRKALPKGAVVTVVHEGEAKQLIARGYLTETNDKPTHDDQSAAAEDEAAEKQRAEARETKEVITQADADATPVENPSAPHALSKGPPSRSPSEPAKPAKPQRQ